MITLQTLPALVLWAVVAIRVLGLGFGWKPGILPAAALVAVSVSLNIDQVYLVVDEILGGQNLLNLIVHLFLGAGLTELSRLILKATGRSHRQWRVLLGMGVALAVLQTTLILIANTEGSATNFTDTFGHLPMVALYQASFFAWVGLILGYTGIESLRRNKTGESRTFGIGIDIMAYGCLTGLLVAGMKMLLLGFAMADMDAPHGLYVFYRVCVAATIIGFSIGFILPGYGRIRGAFAARAQRAQALDSLRPIVRRLAETSEGQRSLGAANINMDARSSATQLYRWLVFIGDIRVLDAGLLSEQERDIVDEIDRNFGNHETARRNAPSAA